jgi:hydroxymethylglutaryl-CoA lyase
MAKLALNAPNAAGVGAIRVWLRFRGRIPADKVLGMVKTYLDAGIQNISLADTAGHAHPEQVEDLYSEICRLDPALELACHFHNTYGLGLANCFAALRSGVTCFEAAFGGLGGCPFTRLPAGNVSTEDLVHSFQRMGIREDIHIDALLAVAKQVSGFFNRDLPGYILKTGSIVQFGKPNT